MAKKEKIEKTNAMNQLDSAGIDHDISEYDYMMNLISLESMLLQH